MPILPVIAAPERTMIASMQVTPLAAGRLPRAVGSAAVRRGHRDRP
ncbi:hypothetical protein KZZ52_09970 [Dactylosporangium sp. AC04546]|nr:hypothetical protein [Dactylosporangium sp. AC04546]WVK85689.1 hypothetical protein KZZ52_09970 [Dactylosporangium sp. AC04546]